MKSFLYAILLYFQIPEVIAKDIYDRWADNLIHASSTEEIIIHNYMALEKIKLEKLCMAERQMSALPLNCQKLTKKYNVKVSHIENLCLNALENTDNLNLLKQMRDLLDEKNQCIKPLNERILDIEYQTSDHLHSPIHWLEKNSTKSSYILYRKQSK